MESNFMDTPDKSYQPIDCNYYDRLEAWATMHAICQIVFRDETEKEQEVSARIADVYALNKVEYMRLDNGLVIRLDSLVSVNNIPLPDHC
jgi:Rho-binding antiterminator